MVKFNCFQEATLWVRIILAVFLIISFEPSSHADTNSPSGIVAWWPGEGNANDTVGTNNGITTSIIYTNGEVGQSLDFNGSGSSIKVPASSSLNVGLANGFTIELWVNPVDIYDPSRQVQDLVEWNNGSGSIGTHLALSTDYPGDLYANIVDTSGTSHFFGSAASLMTANVLQHVALTYDKTTGLAVLYRNGIAVATQNFGSITPQTSYDFFFGTRPSGPFTPSYYNGLEDEVSLYNRALSSNEIAAIYNAGSAGKGSLTGPPVIYTQPISLTVASGNNAVFSVSAGGLSGVAYQWWSGASIVGAWATNSTLTLTNVQLSNAGSYFVVVSNLLGSVTSSNAVLSVTNQAPYIVTQPQSSNVIVGVSATFTVSAGGSMPFSYQWRFNTTNIVGATNSSYAIPSVQTTNAGLYSVVVANSVDSTTSSNAALTVTVLPTTVSDDFEPGIDLTQWSVFGGTVLATNYGGYVSPSNSLWFGGTGSRFATTRLLNTVAGGPIVFDLRLASGTSNKWETVDLPTKGIVLEYSINQGATWTLIANYSTSIYTNWTLVSTNIPIGAKAPATLFRWRQLANSGANFDHWALDDIGVGWLPPQIFAQPTNQIATVGQNATFHVAVTGSAPFSYQWRSNTANIFGATNASVTVNNVQLAQSGDIYSVVVTNVGGSVTSSNAVLTVNLPPATIQVVNTNATDGTTVDIPVIFAANGNENALSFSLSFDTNRLSYSDINLGGAIPNDASFLPNTSQPGVVGVSLLLPTGHTFAAGTQEVVSLTFNVPIFTGTQTVATAVGFTNFPINKLLSDVNVHALPASFVNGTVTLSPAPLEGDVTGDGNVDIFDWQQVGRFVAGLDIITNPGVFQSADCAPRLALGDGQIKVTDWVQAGRYAAGLDPLTLAGGPTSPVTPGFKSYASPSGGIQPKDSGLRQLSVADGTVVKGLPVTLPVNLLAQGNESALAFSLSFDPTVLRYVNTSKGSAASSATLNVNTNLAASGELAVALMLPAGSSHFATGTREVVKVTFIGVSTVTNYSVGFADQPALRSISDTNAVELTATYVGNSVTINPNPPLSISTTDTNVVLTWPIWAADFTLQSAGLASPPFTWTNVPLTVQTNGANVQVTAPASAQNGIFRLMHP